jgi:hypothetical protein
MKDQERMALRDEPKPATGTPRRRRGTTRRAWAFAANLHRFANEGTASGTPKTLGDAASADRTTRQLVRHLLGRNVEKGRRARRAPARILEEESSEGKTRRVSAICNTVAR